MGKYYLLFTIVNWICLKSRKYCRDIQIWHTIMNYVVSRGLRLLISTRIYFEEKGIELLGKLGVTKTEFARRTGIHRQNVNALFKTNNLEIWFFWNLLKQSYCLQVGDHDIENGKRKVPRGAQNQQVSLTDVSMITRRLRVITRLWSLITIRKVISRKAQALYIQ